MWMLHLSFFFRFWCVFNWLKFGELCFCASYGVPQSYELKVFATLINCGQVFTMLHLLPLKGPEVCLYRIWRDLYEPPTRGYEIKNLKIFLVAIMCNGWHLCNCWFFSNMVTGFIKFMESYYMIVVTRRRQIGTVCGHAIYSIEESQLITVPHSTVQSEASYSKVELRYSPSFPSHFFPWSLQALINWVEFASTSIV